MEELCQGEMVKKPDLIYSERRDFYGGRITENCRSRWKATPLRLIKRDKVKMRQQLRVWRMKAESLHRKNGRQL
jgi:hypothetical protein